LVSGQTSKDKEQFVVVVLRSKKTTSEMVLATTALLDLKVKRRKESLRDDHFLASRQKRRSLYLERLPPIEEPDLGPLQLLMSSYFFGAKPRKTHPERYQSRAHSEARNQL
jgi:hypothetical protein